MTAYEQLEADLAAASAANAELTAKIQALDSDLNASYGALDEAQKLLTQVSERLAKVENDFAESTAMNEVLASRVAELESQTRDVEVRAQEIIASKIGTSLVPLEPAAPVAANTPPAPESKEEFLEALAKISDPLEHAKFYQAHKEIVFGK